MKEYVGRLPSLEDERGVRYTMDLYAHAMDYGEEEVWRDCFTQDALFLVSDAQQSFDEIYRVQGGETLAAYAVRRQTRHQHMEALRRIYGYRMFPGRGPYARAFRDWLLAEAEQARSNDDLARRFIARCRETMTILPAITTIERLCADALVAKLSPETTAFLLLAARSARDVTGGRAAKSMWYDYSRSSVHICAHIIPLPPSIWAVQRVCAPCRKKKTEPQIVLLKRIAL